MYDFLCKANHPDGEQIVHYTRQFKCPNDGTVWTDTWCADCNDRCPTCNAEITPERVIHEEVIAA
jgi:hypothetical protein